MNALKLLNRSEMKNIMAGGDETIDPEFPGIQCCDGEDCDTCVNYSPGCVYANQINWCGEKTCKDVNNCLG